MQPKLGFFKFLLPAFLIVIALASSVVIVGPGQRGVLLNFGAVSPNVWGEGLHFKIPVYQNVVR
ncbi:MAG: SPFH domain-containing protein, partial [Thermodesulfobacteriota bacterium]